MKFKLFLSAALLVAMSGTSFAQGFPTIVTPTYNGGYTIYNPNTPSQFPSVVTPTYNGGYSVYNPNTPSQFPTTITPTYNGGFSIYDPNY